MRRPGGGSSGGALPQTPEQKYRLFYLSAGRGHGLGTLLSQAALSAAGAAGYRLVRLDTLPGMLAAQRLYEAIGFSDTEPYRFNPVPGTRYMELVINPSGGEQWNRAEGVLGC